MKRMFLSLLLAAFFIMSSPAHAAPSNAPILASYTGPNGIKIISHHPDWIDKTRLQSVYNELIRNTHYEEINYLSTVRILAGDYQSLYSGGVLTRTWSNGKVEKLLSENNEIWYYPDPGQGTAADMAYTLAHEYGHHFTIYYLWKKEQVDLTTNWQQSQYANLRQLATMDQVGSGRSIPHEWQPVEIAASDYLQLFGSPNARKAVSFPENHTYYSSEMYNLQPQENMSLPLAAQVPGLIDYWHSLTNKQNTSQPPSAPILALTGSHYGEYTTPYLEFHWSKSIDDKVIPLTYTLLQYDSPQDALGTPVAVLKDQTQADKLTYTNEHGTKYYRVVVIDSDGFAVASNLLPVNLDSPMFQPIPESAFFRDVSVNHWAYRQIGGLVEKGVISGYADQSFKPNQSITRAEFISLLCNTLNLPSRKQQSISFSDTTKHWAQTSIATAKELGIASGYVDNSFKPNNPVSRAEAATMLATANKLWGAEAISLPKDITLHWARQAIAAVLAADLMSGYPGGSFKPENNLTRAEAAAIISRL